MVRGPKTGGLLCLVLPELRQYVVDTERILGISVDGIPAQFGTFFDEAVGKCCVLGRFRWVVIDRRWWAANTDYWARMALLLHEYGQCALERMAHTSGHRADWCETSLMNEYVVSGYCFRTHFQSYVDELKSGNF